MDIASIECLLEGYDSGMIVKQEYVFVMGDVDVVYRFNLH